MSRKTILYINGRQNPHERMAEMKAARQSGLDIVLLGKQLPDWAMELSVESVLLDLNDDETVKSRVMELDKRYDFCGVVCWSETDVPLRSVLTEALGLPGMEPDFVIGCRDKIAMKRKLDACQDLLPQWDKIDSLASAVASAARIGYPVILKPSSGSGSKGIFKIEHEDELEAALAALAHIANAEFDAVFSRFGGDILMEEYVDGPEFSVDGYVHDHTITFVGITDYQSDQQTFVENRHIFPSALPATYQQVILKSAERLITALNINASMFHLEGKYSRHGFRFIECAARPAGGYISTHLLQSASGEKHLSNYFRVCQGLAPEPLPAIHDTVGVRYLFAEKAGNYSGCENLDEILRHPAIQHVYMHFPPGHHVVLPPDDFNAYRLGVVIASHPDSQQLASILEWAAQTIRFNIV